MDYEDLESVLRQALRGQTRRAVLLADSRKFGRQANLQTFDLAAPLTVVTDRQHEEWGGCQKNSVEQAVSRRSGRCRAG
jgi:DeoR family glycerol-3-phosphate regulon repressor